jgi:hypothetical protein
MPRRVATGGKGKGPRKGENPLPAILARAISRAKSPALRHWLTELASDRATGTGAADRTPAEGPR